MSSSSSSGSEGCPCIDAASTLAAATDRRCSLVDGEEGIQLTVGGSCVPLSYGSAKCLQHDLIHDPTCQHDVGDHVVPAYCFRPWCYVDMDRCRAQSSERVFRTSYFQAETGIDAFFSYSTCNSTAEDWLAVENDIVGSRTLGGVSIRAAVPGYQLPLLYKRDPNSSEILSSPGSEYYLDSIPFEGVYPSYLRSVAEISGGDIQNVSFTHRSRASSLVHPTSSYTAVVQDIQDGLVDMGIGPFWVTAQRLKMASFTLPIVYDKTLLVIPRPGTVDTLNDQIQKVLAPFSNGLWILTLAIIVTAALFSVWFNDRALTPTRQTNRRMALRGDLPRNKRRAAVYCRLCLDSFLQKGQFFCSAGVEQEEGGSLPNKLLMFGFAFFILITVSAYVANLAAFLTRSSTDAVSTMDGAIAAGLTICAHPAVKAELEVAWPEAKFFFHQSGNEFNGMLEEDYDSGRCRVLAVGWEDTSSDAEYLEKLCARDLVYTDSLIAEIPIAFPIRSQLAAGLSYWIVNGERKHGTSINIAKEEFAPSVSCSVRFSGEDTQSSEYDQITIKNMFFPLVIFGACLVLAVLLQLKHHYDIKKGRESLMGRRSTFNLGHEGRRRPRRRSSDEKKDDGDEEVGHSSRLSSITSWARRKSMEKELDSKDADVFGEDGVGGLPSTRMATSSVNNFDDNSQPVRCEGTKGE